MTHKVLVVEIREEALKRIVASDTEDNFRSIDFVELAVQVASDQCIIISPAVQLIGPLLKDDATSED